ncbi:MAG: hypothetical protein PHO67_08290 [Candidatus Omnitrophica bacterium]|nr:hypothetical protein [Candidatus Omnitrophota bacterium]
MAIVYKAQLVDSEYTAAITSTDNWNVAVGDLLVVFACSNDSAVTINAIADSAGNTYTLLTELDSNNSVMRVGWCIATNAGATTTITVTGSAAATLSIWAVSFTPDAGDTVTREFTATGSGAWDASPWATGADSTTGDDEAVVACFMTGSGDRTFSSQVIGGTAATVLTAANGGGTYFYRILTGAAEDIIAQTNVSGAAAFAAHLLAFKSTGGEPAGSIVPQAMMHYMRKKAGG